MFRWIKDKFQKYRLKLLGNYLDDLYDYRIRFILMDAIQLYDNTWDKDKIKSIILNLAAMDLERYSKDEEVRELIFNKFNNYEGK